MYLEGQNFLAMDIILKRYSIFLTKDTPKLIRMKDIENGFKHFIQKEVKKEENDVWKTMFI